MKNVANFVVACCCLLFSARQVQAEQINAQSCSLDHVKSAVDAASSGDTVVVPAGTCTWNSALAIPTEKKIVLQGAGPTATVINNAAINMSRSGSRVTGFRINEGEIRVDGVGWRIDNCSIHSSSFARGVWVTSDNPLAVPPSGLVDNCSFYNARVLVYGTAAMLNENDWQNRIWTNQVALGKGTNVVYIEDCLFQFSVFGNAIDANYGGAYVFRFNTLIDVYAECHACLGNNRATRHWELYGNLFDRPGDYFWYPVFLRGGTGVVFDNVFKGNWTNFGTILDNRRSFDADHVSSLCNGTSALDGNTGVGDEAGYPCRDQIGRGCDTQLWDHNFPGPYSQPLLPAYAWGNRRQSNNTLAPFHVAGNSRQHIKENRDYYNQTDSFDGTVGVGVGTLDKRPQSCATGVAYWATDQGSWNNSGSGGQGVLYKCVSNDRWEIYYTPYEYPHPLRTAGDRTPPAAPANLSTTPG